MHLDQACSFELRPDMEFFSEGGIGPNGECWVVPTQNFLRVWQSPAGDFIKKRGFHLRNDGKQRGASQDCVLIMPRLKFLV